MCLNVRSLACVGLGHSWRLLALHSAPCATTHAHTPSSSPLARLTSLRVVYLPPPSVGWYLQPPQPQNIIHNPKKHTPPALQAGALASGRAARAAATCGALTETTRTSTRARTRHRAPRAHALGPNPGAALEEAGARCVGGARREASWMGGLGPGCKNRTSISEEGHITWA